MQLKSITVGGFKNLKSTRLDLNGITAIISTNNYGKSNLLESIDFAVDFISNNARIRKSMMAWTKAIPINKVLANDEFSFEIEFEDPSFNQYRYVKYGYSFKWYRDDGSGQKITNEWLDARESESVRFTQYLKRNEGKYRKEKGTSSFRKISLDDSQLAIDVLSSIDDLEISPIIQAIKDINYHVCSSLDLGDRFSAVPFEYVSPNSDGGISFDDNDVPHALYQLQSHFPEKYDLFLEAIFTFFSEFEDITVQSYELKKENIEANMLLAKMDSKESIPESENNTDKSSGSPDIATVPFRIRDELYRMLIKSKNLNQPIDMARMSTGTKRVFWLLANIFIASAQHMSFIGVEELETSIHPRLLKNLLEILSETIDHAPLIISSHSPFLVQYLKPEKIYVGVPNDNGIAEFKRVQENRISSLLKASRGLGLSVGEYLFELMSGDEDSFDALSFYLEA